MHPFAAAAPASSTSSLVRKTLRWFSNIRLRTAPELRVLHQQGKFKPLHNALPGICKSEFEENHPVDCARLHIVQPSSPLLYARNESAAALAVDTLVALLCTGDVREASGSLCAEGVSVISIAALVASISRVPCTAVETALSNASLERQDLFFAPAPLAAAAESSSVSSSTSSSLSSSSSSSLVATSASRVVPDTPAAFQTPARLLVSPSILKNFSSTELQSLLKSSPVLAFLSPLLSANTKNNLKLSRVYFTPLVVLQLDHTKEQMQSDDAVPQAGEAGLDVAAAEHVPALTFQSELLRHERDEISDLIASLSLPTFSSSRAAQLARLKFLKLKLQQDCFDLQAISLGAQELLQKAQGVIAGDHDQDQSGFDVMQDLEGG